MRPGTAALPVLVPGPLPVLVAVAHGTRDPRGTATTRALLARVRRLRPDLDVREAYVELAAPLLPDVVAAVEGPFVVVPLLLTPGHHVQTDLPRALDRRSDGVVALPLGCDPLVVDALADRLACSGARPGDALLLAAAGSADPGARREVERAAAALSRRVGTPVEVAYASAAGPRVEEVVQRLRAAGHPRVTAVRYLLAPGRFADQVARAGADAVTDVLGDSDRLARLVVQRWEAAAAALGVAPLRVRRRDPVEVPVA